MTKVVIISTGGTIATKFDPAKGGMMPALSGDDIVKNIPQLQGVADIHVIEYSNIPSSSLSPKMMFLLAQRIESVLLDESVKGVVVTHGTDTLEETAYIADLYHDSPKPVCFTAAMRGIDEVSSDANNNLLCAVQLALSPKARELGVLVVMNDEIHAAQEVMKIHSANRFAFASPFWGPLGVMDNGAVVIKRQSICRRQIRPDDIAVHVPLVKAYTGMDSAVLRFYADTGINGIVIEGMGRGNVPNTIIDGVRYLLKRNIPVVLATRVLGGSVLDIYAYDGGAKQLKDLGVTLAGEISGQKARLKLMMVLGLTNKGVDTYFDNSHITAI